MKNDRFMLIDGSNKVICEGVVKELFRGEGEFHVANGMAALKEFEVGDIVRFAFKDGRKGVFQGEIVDILNNKIILEEIRSLGNAVKEDIRVNTDFQSRVYMKDEDGQILAKNVVIADISAVETVPINISGITSDKELIGILQLPEGVTAQTLDTEFRADAEIAVYLYVQPIQSQQNLEAVIGVRNVQDGLDFVLDTEKVSLTLKGDAELLAQQPILDQLLFYVDCNHLAAGTYTLPIQVEALNETVHEALQEVSPQTVTVTLQAEVMILPNREPENGNEVINSDSDKTIDAE